MKIAFCLFKYFPHGGLQRDFFHIAQYCHQQGHEIHVFTMSFEGFLPDDFHLHLIEVNGRQNHTKVMAFNNALQRLHLNQQYDLVIGFNKMAGLDIYYAADRCFAAKKHSKLHRLLPRYAAYKKLEQEVFRVDSTTEVLLIAKRELALFHSFYRTQPHRFHELHPGIDRKFQKYPFIDQRAATRARLGLEQHQRMLLQVGSSFKTKGLDRSLHAMAKLPVSIRSKCKLYVIGKGDQETYMVLARKLNIAANIVFLGPQDDVIDYYAAADLLLHPSLHENTGTVLIEAMAAGVEILTTDACGYAPYVKDANAGIVIKSQPFRQAEFNTALQVMLAAGREPLGKNGTKYIKQHDFYDLPKKAYAVIAKIGAQRAASC